MRQRDRTTATHRCGSCGASAPRWSGRCSACGEWNAMAAEPALSRRPSAAGAHEAPRPLSEVDIDAGRPRPTGLAELDRVLAGGFVPGSVTLLYGEPGVGKSTLLLQVLTQMAGRGATVLLVSAEESAAQVRGRAERLGPPPPGLFVSASPEVGCAEAALRALSPDLTVVDSIQTLAAPDVAGPPGCLTQVRACADRLVRLAKEEGLAVVLVGQVTKGGDVAGPRALEHLVDTVVAFDGDRHHSLRVLRAVKHRFGTTGEVGLFEMGEHGLDPLADPGHLLLGDRRPSTPGSAVTALLEGRRPLLVELQALCYPGSGARRRSGVGVDPARLSVLLAVLECRAGVDLGPLDVAVSVTGGLRAAEPAADLPLCLAVASAHCGVPLDDGVVAFGEVGLGGELRQVPGTPRRLAESARLGITKAVVPASTPADPAPVALVRAATVTEAIAAAGLVP